MSMRKLFGQAPGARRFALGAILNALGVGVFYSFALLYYQEVSGLSLTTVGTVLTAAMLAVLPLMPLVGRIADRAGAKRMLIAAALVRAAAFAGYEMTHGLTAFALITMAAALGVRVEQVAAPMLCAGAGPRESETWIALYRTTFNAGLGGGALIASLLLANADYHMLSLGTGLCFLASALSYATLPPSAPARAPRAEQPAPAWRHGAFLRIALVNSVFWLAALVLEYGLPVYLVRSLELPVWTVGGFFAVNTVLVTLAQLPVSRLLTGRDQARAVVVGCLLYLAASLLLAGAGYLGHGARLGGVLAVALIWTVGELIIGHCVLVLLIGIAPAERRGGYLAFSQLLVGVTTAFAPLLVAAVLAARAPLLWWSLAAVIVCAVLLVPRHPVLTPATSSPESDGATTVAS